MFDFEEGLDASRRSVYIGVSKVWEVMAGGRVTYV